MLMMSRISFNILTEVQGTGKYGKFIERNRKKNIYLTVISLVTVMCSVLVVAFMIYSEFK